MSFAPGNQRHRATESEIFQQPVDERRLLGPAEHARTGDDAEHQLEHDERHRDEPARRAHQDRSQDRQERDHDEGGLHSLSVVNRGPTRAASRGVRRRVP